MIGEESSMKSDIPSLTRVKLSYIVAEDRIQLSGLDNRGRILKLWLTAKLLNLLVPHLVRRQAEFELQSSTTDSYGTRTNPVGEDQQLIESCEHAYAEALVSEIRLRSRQMCVCLIFKDGYRGICASFTLSVDTLAAWNRGLKKCFEQAGWPLESFLLAAENPALAPNKAVTIH